MLTVNHEEYTDNVISYQFHVQSCLIKHAFTIITEISYIHIRLKVIRSDIFPKMRFLQKGKFFTNYLRNNICFTFTILSRKRILS